MCLRCGLEDYWISDFPKPENPEKRFHPNVEKTKTYAYRSKKIDKELERSTKRNEAHKIYEYIARIPSNVESPRRDFGDIWQLENWIFRARHDLSHDTGHF